MNVALVLGGGVALGAYHGGAYAALHERPKLHPARIAGSSVGAVMGALILGKAPQERMPRLRVFWGDAALDTPWPGADTLGDEWRRASNRLAILQVRALGRAGFFHSRLPSALLGSDSALYDPAPLRERLASSIDFERLNQASFSLTCTDLESGEAVEFDTRRGARIAPEHLIRLVRLRAGVPCAGDRRTAPRGRRTLCQRAGGRSTGATPRAIGQCSWWTFSPARAAGRGAWKSRSGGRVRVITLAYRAPSYEGGVEKPFNFSRSTLGALGRRGARHEGSDSPPALGGPGISQVVGRFRIGVEQAVGRLETHDRVGQSAQVGTVGSGVDRQIDDLIHDAARIGCVGCTIARLRHGVHIRGSPGRIEPFVPESSNQPLRLPAADREHPVAMVAGVPPYHGNARQVG